MSIHIVKVESHNQLKKFVTFPLKLYKDCENWEPTTFVRQTVTLPIVMTKLWVAWQL